MAKGSKKPKHPILALNTAPWRQQRGWSRADLAERMGISENSLRRYERGEVNWDQETLQRAASELGVSIAAILPQRPDSVLAAWSLVPPDQREAALAMLRGLAQSAG
jgi:transcriptional regulator with XRE-family HTH domain